MVILAVLSILSLVIVWGYGRLMRNQATARGVATTICTAMLWVNGIIAALSSARLLSGLLPALYTLVIMAMTMVLTMTPLVRLGRDVRFFRQQSADTLSERLSKKH